MEHPERHDLIEPARAALARSGRHVSAFEFHGVRMFAKRLAPPHRHWFTTGPMLRLIASAAGFPPLRLTPGDIAAAWRTDYELTRLDAMADGGVRVARVLARASDVIVLEDGGRTSTDGSKAGTSRPASVSSADSRTTSRGSTAPATGTAPRTSRTSRSTPTAAFGASTSRRTPARWYRCRSSSPPTCSSSSTRSRSPARSASTSPRCCSPNSSSGTSTVTPRRASFASCAGGCPGSSRASDSPRCSDVEPARACAVPASRRESCRRRSAADARTGPIPLEHHRDARMGDELAVELVQLFA